MVHSFNSPCFAVCLELTVLVTILFKSELQASYGMDQNGHQSEIGKQSFGTRDAGSAINCIIRPQAMRTY